MFIDSISSALGEQEISMEESAARGWLKSNPTHFREVGFAIQRVCDPKTSPYDLARRAVETIKHELDGVGAILYHAALPVNAGIGDQAEFTKTGEIRYLTDFPVSHLQNDFGLDRAFVMGIGQQACTGFIGAIRLAHALLNTENDLEKILCVTADRVPEGALHESTYNPLADGAIATIVHRQPRGFRILGIHQITNGAMSLVSPDEVVGSYFSYTHRLVHELLAKVKLTVDDVHWIIPQNLTHAAWQVMSSLLKFDHARVLYPTIAEVGHLVSGCNFVNLVRALEEGRIRSGERVLLPVAGYGLNWQAILLQKE